MGRLFLRIFLWFWLGSTCLLVVLALSVALVRPDALTAWRAVSQSSMLALGSQTADLYERDGPAAAEAALADIERRARFRAWLYTAAGRPIGAPAPMAGVADLIARTQGDAEAARGAGDSALLLARRVRSRSSTPYVFVWESPLRARLPLTVSGWPFTLRVAALVLTGGVVCWWLASQITRPIRTLREAARQFAEGDLTVRVANRRELRRGDELAELARDFDRMAARIEQLVTAQQQLLADISHELRSPLARLSLALDLARRRAADLPEHDRIAREIVRINDLIEQLLTLARLQASSRGASADLVALRELLHDVVQDARFEADARGRRVALTRECDAVARGSRALLRSAVENVVRNAIRHAPADSDVDVAMDRDRASGRLAIVVRDRGPGVPAEALGRLFDPFYRVDDARDRDSGGVGLGLAIVRQAMLAHGGEASAHNHPDGGLVVRLELPVDG